MSKNLTAPRPYLTAHKDIALTLVAASFPGLAPFLKF